MTVYEQESQKSTTIFVFTMFFAMYLFISAIVSSYFGEKYNKQISVKEYINITISLPFIAFAYIFQELQKEFEDSTPILDRCIIRCHGVK